MEDKKTREKAGNKRTIDAKSKLVTIGRKQSKKVSFIVTDKEGKDEGHLSCEEMIEGIKKKFRKEIRALREDWEKKIRSLEEKIITAEKLVIELREELRREEEKRREDTRKKK